MADWATISSLATAGGTLVLASATFVAVRSSNRAARAAEESMLAGLRPLLTPSRPDDPAQKVGFADNKWLRVEGSGAAAEVSAEAVYLAISLRNVGSGIAVLHAWHLHPEWNANEHAPLDEFRHLTRDLYIAPGEIGFWEGAFRDPASPEFAAARAAVEEPHRFMIEILYGDDGGGQRVIGRFGLTPHGDGKWFAIVAKHWNLDRPAPR